MNVLKKSKGMINADEPRLDVPAKEAQAQGLLCVGVVCISNRDFSIVLGLETVAYYYPIYSLGSLLEAKHEGILGFDQILVTTHYRLNHGENTPLIRKARSLVTGSGDIVKYYN